MSTSTVKRWVAGIAIVAIVGALIFLITPSRGVNRAYELSNVIAEKTGSRPAVSPKSVTDKWKWRADKGASTMLPQVSADGSSADRLPPIGTPLRESFKSLSSEADRGNFRAMCRLGVDLQLCGLLPKLIGAIDKVKKGASSGAVGEQTANRTTTASGEKFAKELSLLCEGFDSASSQIPAWQYLFSAAQSGHVPSMTRFAIAPPLDPFEPIDSLQGWGAYGAFAPAFLEHAANSGDPVAVMYLAGELTGNLVIPAFHLGGVELAPTDYQRAAMYFYALRSIPDYSSLQAVNYYLSKLKTVLNAEQLDRAQRQGIELFRSWPPINTKEKAVRVRGQILPKAGTECFD